MRTLLVMRHGKSDWSSEYGGDHERPLNDRGVRSARDMGRVLTARGQVPGHVMSSTAVRARTTAELVIESGGWQAPLTLHDEMYDSGVEGTVDLIRTAPDVPLLMVVGHQPTWSMLVRELTGAAATMKTAAVAIVELPVDGWDETGPGGSLVEELTPSTVAGASESGVRIPEGQWEVDRIAVGGELVPPLEGTHLNIEVSGDHISGSAGVNRFMGQINPDGMGPLATTMMAGPPERMEQERRFLGYLESAQHAETTNSGINLVESGLITLTLTSVRPSSRNPKGAGDV